jgi:hypothetical protein
VAAAAEWPALAAMRLRSGRGWPPYIFERRSAWSVVRLRRCIDRVINAYPGIFHLLLSLQIFAGVCTITPGLRAICLSCNITRPLLTTFC